MSHLGSEFALILFLLTAQGRFAAGRRGRGVGGVGLGRTPSVGIGLLGALGPGIRLGGCGAGGAGVRAEWELGCIT